MSLSSGVPRRVGDGEGVCVGVCVDVGAARVGVRVDVGTTRAGVGVGAGGRRLSSMLRTVPRTMLATISKAITANTVCPLLRLLLRFTCCLQHHLPSHSLRPCRAG